MALRKSPEFWKWHVQEVGSNRKYLKYIRPMTFSLVNPEVVDNQSLFRQVIILDYRRILTRLGSRHVKSKRRGRDQQILFKRLSTILNDELITVKNQVALKGLEKIRTQVELLGHLFDKLENIHQPRADSSAFQEASMDLVRQAYKLTLIPEFWDVLGSSSKASLLKKVEKIGRYYTASIELISAARHERHRIFNHVAIEVVNLQAQTKPLGPNNTSTLLGSVGNVIRSESPVQQEAIVNILEAYFKKSLAQAEQKFRSGIIRTDLFKVHCEIQLLLYYEMHPECSRPSIICSSKSACYLCDLFFTIHGQFIIPRTHGRMYHKWILPDFARGPLLQRKHELDVVVQRFNEALEAKITHTLGNQKMRYSDPNESELTSIASFPPSISSAILHRRPSEALTTIHPVDIRTDAPRVSSPSLKTMLVKKSNLSMNSCSAESSDETSTASSSPEMITHSEYPSTKTNHMFSTGSSAEHQSSKETLITFIQHQPSEYVLSIHELLIRGQSIRRQILHSAQLIRVCIDYMHLELSRDATSTDDVVTSQQCWVEVKWLDNYEKLQTSDIKYVFHMRDMAHGLPITTSHGSARSTTDLYLQVGQELISIKYSYDESPEHHI